MVIYSVYIKAFKRKITIEGEDYIVSVEYGNILKEKRGKKVVHFDECYTTNVGSRPEYINEDSLCGQYLLDNPISNMEQLIQEANVKPMSSMSLFQKKTRYKSGTLIPRGNDLLLSFAHLDKDGLGMFPSIADYIDCLFTLWSEVNKHYGQNDVCVPILGAGVTRFPNGNKISAQELLRLMIWTYKMSPKKIDKPNKLRIICKKREDFMSLEC